MSLDNLYGEALNSQLQDDAKPPAEKVTVFRFCKYCRKPDHVACKSKKCTALPDGTNLYSSYNGSLLSEPKPVAMPALDATGLAL